jgi:hypothetical protein
MRACEAMHSTWLIDSFIHSASASLDMIELAWRLVWYCLASCRCISVDIGKKKDVHALALILGKRERKRKEIGFGIPKSNLRSRRLDCSSV